jgi:hypothetical protein
MTRARPSGRGLKALAGGCAAAAVAVAMAACGSPDAAERPGTTTAATTAPAAASPDGCPPAPVVASDLGIEGLVAAPDVPAPTATTTLVCGWEVGRIGEEGGATVRFSVDTLPDSAAAESGYDFSRETMGGCARTGSCEAGDDVADDVFEGDERSFVTSDVSDLTATGGEPFFSTVIIAAARHASTNCSLAVNIGSADRGVVIAPVRPARRAVADYCRAQGA